MPTKVAIQAEKDFAANMTQLMEIMKGLALASYVKLKKEKERRFQEFIQSFDPFFHIADLTKAKNPFIKNDIQTVGIVLVSSDESFMSGLNSKVVKLALSITEDRPSHFLVVGKKVIGRLRSEGKTISSFPALRPSNMYEVAVLMKDVIMEKVKAKEIGPVIGVFADPISFSTQRATEVPLLPAHDVYPKEMNKGADPNDLIYQESKIDVIMDYLVQIWITNKIFQMFQDSKMSEFASQAMQLEGSLQNLVELNRKLKLQFVKKRGELIDSSLREVMSALLVT